MKAVIYARQSSGKEDLSESVEAQIQNCRSIAEKEHLEIIGIYKDLNSSGELYPEGAEEIAKQDFAYQTWLKGQTSGKASRPGLGALIRKIPEADILLVNEMTRLYRPVTHSFLENYIHNLLQSNGITVIQVQGGEINLNKFDQQLVLALKNRILYEDLRKKRENSINAFRIKRNSGKLCCGSRIFAISYLGNDKISVDSEKAKIVKQIFSKIILQIPLNRIIRECNEQTGKYIMYPSLLHSIARQPLYAGFQYDSEGKLIRNIQITGQEIVSLEDWLSVQGILNKNKKKGLKTNSHSHWLPLSGRLFCGNCGSKLVCRIDHGKVYYSCNLQKFDPAHMNCGASRIRFESGAYGKPALYDAVIPLLIIGVIEKHVKGRTAKDFSAESCLAELTELFSHGYLTKHEMCSISLRIKEEHQITNADLQKISLCYIRQIIRKEISVKMFEEFLRWADLKAVVHRQYIDFQTVAGNILVLRSIENNRSGMPLWSVRLRKKIDSSKNQNGFPGITICYFTGKKEILADFGTVKVVSK